MLSFALAECVGYGLDKFTEEVSSSAEVSARTTEMTIDMYKCSSPKPVDWVDAFVLAKFKIHKWSAALTYAKPPERVVNEP